MLVSCFEGVLLKRFFVSCSGQVANPSIQAARVQQPLQKETLQTSASSTTPPVSPRHPPLFSLELLPLPRSPPPPAFLGFLSAQLCKIHRAEVLAPQRDGPHNWEDSGSSPGAGSIMRHGRQKTSTLPTNMVWCTDPCRKTTFPLETGVVHFHRQFCPPPGREGLK